ncbi:COP9 signalosome catalytic subunit rri1 [Thecaphora frezii]
MMDAATAQRNFEVSNSMLTLDASSLDQIFRYDDAAQRSILRSAPWRSDPHYFKTVRISAVALIKMVMHARSGGIYEIMGLMQGKVDAATQTIYVMDAFALPVQGTETRVNAQNEANEFMVEYLESSKRVGRLENAIGWYHSHPGYGCWLSGIDVDTQMTNQRYQDPFVAVVIDPNRTISAGKVDIGAFRTFPEGYKPHDAQPSEYQSIPLSKIEDFGVHANAYYPLKVEHFKSSLDGKLLELLWNKYWVNTLSQSPLVVNRAYATGQLRDLADKLASAARPVAGKSRTTQPLYTSSPTTVQQQQQQEGKGTEKLKGKEAVADSATTAAGAGAEAEAEAGVTEENNIEKLVKETRKREDETPLAKAYRDASKVSTEAQHGLLAQMLKDVLFNRSSLPGSVLPIEEL